MRTTRTRLSISPLQFSLASLLLVVACFAAILGWLRPWEPEPSVERNWSQLSVGMTTSEVEELIGEPEVMYQSGLRWVYFYWQGSPAPKAVEFQIDKTGKIATVTEICDELTQEQMYLLQ